MSKLFEIDIIILRLIQNNRIELFDSVLFWISESAYFIATGIILYLGFLVFIKKSESIKAIFLRLVFMFFMVTLIVISLKYGVLRSRPFVLYQDIINLTEATTPSFPSGHTAIVFTLALGLAFLGIKKLYYLPVLVWAIIVAYSRMALGVHFPSDVFASMVLAFVIVLTIKNLPINKWRLKQNKA